MNPVFCFVFFYLEPVRTQQSRGVPLRRPSLEDYDPACQPGWHLRHVWGGGLRSKTAKHSTAPVSFHTSSWTSCLLAVREINDDKYSGFLENCHVFAAFWRKQSLALVNSIHSNQCRCIQLTCQCPCRTALNSGTMPLLLGWATAAPCSSNRRQTSSFPRPEAAVRAGRTNTQWVRGEMMKVNVVVRNQVFSSSGCRHARVICQMRQEDTYKAITKPHISHISAF